MKGSDRGRLVIERVNTFDAENSIGTAKLYGVLVKSFGARPDHWGCTKTLSSGAMDATEVGSVEHGSVAPAMHDLTSVISLGTIAGMSEILFRLPSAA